MDILVAFLGLIGISAFVLCFLAWILLRIPALKKRFGKRSTSIRNAMLTGLALSVVSIFLTNVDDSQASAESNALVNTSSNENLAVTPTPAEETARLANVTITSDPEGAELTINGDRKGSTPVSFQVPVDSTISYRLVAEDDIAEYDLYVPFEGSLEVADDEAISVWIERTTADEQVAQKATFEEEQRQALYEANRKRLEDAEVDVSIVCEDLVKDSLRAPSTAKFPGIFSGGRDYRFNIETGKAVYTSYVDAQNGFGAMLRSDFACSYDLSSNQVSLEYFE